MGLAYLVLNAAEQARTFNGISPYFSLPAWIPISEYGIIVALIASILVSAIIFLLARREVNRSKLHDRIKHAINLIFAVPIPAVIIGLTLIEIVNTLSISFPYIGTAEIILVIEVAILAIVFRTLGTVAKIVMQHLTGHKEADRILIYGIYTLGLLALIFVLLTSPISPAVAGSVWQIVGFISGLIVVYLSVYIINAALNRYSAILTNKDPQLGLTLAFGRRLAVAVVALLGVAIVTFASFPGAGATVASLFVAAGFASIVVGMAAQSSLSNIFAGMIVSTSRPFKIGDAVLFQMPWGAEWCWVEDMRLSFTILKTWDKRRLVIPNQLFLSTALVNYTMSDPSKLCIVFIQVPYEANLDMVIKIMKEEARKHHSFVPVKGLPTVHVMEYDESGVQLRLLSNAAEQGANFQMSKDLLYSIRKRLMKAGINIQYPRRELVFKDAPPGFFGGKMEPQSQASPKRSKK